MLYFPFQISWDLPKQLYVFFLLPLFGIINYFLGHQCYVDDNTVIHSSPSIIPFKDNLKSTKP